jgi:hypothetical protein
MTIDEALVTIRTVAAHYDEPDEPTEADAVREYEDAMSAAADDTVKASRE